MAIAEHIHLEIARIYPMLEQKLLGITILCGQKVPSRHASPMNNPGALRRVRQMEGEGGK